MIEHLTRQLRRDEGVRPRVEPPWLSEARK